MTVVTHSCVNTHTTILHWSLVVNVYCKSIGSESKFSSVHVMASQGLSNEIVKLISNYEYDISTIASDFM